MPEGHTIHRLARDLSADLAGQVVSVSSPQGRVNTDAVDGTCFVGAEACGKHLFVRFERALMHIHLGLFGKFRRFRPPFPEPRDSIRLRVEGMGALWQLTGATRSVWIDDDEQRLVIDSVGPDPLSADADASRAWHALKRSSRPLGALLLDQTVIAGIGNVYRAEILHLLRLPPDLPGNELAHATFRKLWRVTCEQLERGLAEGRIRTVDSAKKRAPRAELVHVYHRSHCKTCGGAVRTVLMAQRNLYYCPRCQPSRG